MPRRTAARAAVTTAATAVLLALSAATTTAGASADEDLDDAPAGLVENSVAFVHAPGLSKPLGRKWQ